MPNLFLCAVILILVVRNQLEAKPLKRRLFTLPLLLLFYAIYVAAQANVQTGEAISLALGTLLGGGVGLIQGRLARVYVDNSTWWVEGSWASLAVWLISIPLRFVVRYGFVELGGIPVVPHGKPGICVIPVLHCRYPIGKSADAYVPLPGTDAGGRFWGVQTSQGSIST